MDNLENENNENVVENENSGQVVENNETAVETVVEATATIVETAFDDFDWDKGPKGVLNYSDN